MNILTTCSLFNFSQLFSLQPPFNTLTYAIIGDDTAPNYFRINSTTGDVFLSSSVQFDTRSTYQVRLQVNDGGIPSRYDSAILTVTVTRNLFRPVFLQSDLERTVTIYEDQILGENIVCVTATDADRRSPHDQVRYEATSTNSGNTLTYFAINSVDGCVYVRQSLRTNNLFQDRFQVSLRN